MGLKKQKKPQLSIQRSNDSFIRPSAPQIAQMNKENPDGHVTNADFEPDVKQNQFGEPAFIQPQNTVQARLKMGQANDSYEKEADAVADNVVQKQNTPEDEVQKKSETTESKEADIEETGASLQLKEGNGAEDKSGLGDSGANFEGKLRSSKGGGSKLAPGVKAEMENGIGSDFSDVNIHTDSNAAEMNDTIGAKAFTNGNDVYFNKSQYNPSSREGKHLLAHELTHTVQQGAAVQRKAKRPQITRTNQNVQGGWWSNLWSSAKSIGNKLWSGAKRIGGAFTSAWKTAMKYVGSGAKWVWNGIKSLGKGAWSWLKNAGKKTWQAIKWFGKKSWSIIKKLGKTLWKKLVWVGSNLWYQLKKFPARVWRLLVHQWEGVKGIFKWAWKGIKGFGKHVWKGITGTWRWLKEGFWGGMRWLADGMRRGQAWAIDFIKAPSWSKLWSGMAGGLSWLGQGVKGFVKWGWRGMQGLAIWARQGLRGMANWIWDGIVGGSAWIGKNFMLILDLLGTGERLQIIWGLFSKMRKLTAAEIAASKKVHPPGMIPYDLIRVDENSIVSKLGGGAPVTTMHIIHSQGSILKQTMVHELTHVAQYEHVGSVYMPEALYAQHKYGRIPGGGAGRGDAYDYIRKGSLRSQINRGEGYKDLNREAQAQLVSDFYGRLVRGKTGNYPNSASAIDSIPFADFQHFINQMANGEF